MDITERIDDFLNEGYKPHYTYEYHHGAIILRPHGTAFATHGSDVKNTVLLQGDDAIEFEKQIAKARGAKQLDVVISNYF